MIHIDDFYKSSIINSGGGHNRAVGYGQDTRYGKRNGEPETFYNLQLNFRKAHQGLELPFIAWLQDKGYTVKQLENTPENITLEVKNKKYSHSYPANPEIDTQYTLIAALEKDLKEIGAHDKSRKR